MWPAGAKGIEQSIPSQHKTPRFTERFICAPCPQLAAVALEASPATLVEPASSASPPLAVLVRGNGFRGSSSLACSLDKGAHVLPAAFLSSALVVCMLPAADLLPLSVDPLCLVVSNNGFDWPDVVSVRSAMPCLLAAAVFPVERIFRCRIYPFPQGVDCALGASLSVVPRPALLDLDLDDTAPAGQAWPLVLRGAHFPLEAVPAWCVRVRRGPLDSVATDLV